MTDVAVVAVGAISALGQDAAAWGAPEAGALPRVAIARDAALAAAGMERPFAARAAVPDGIPDRAGWLLRRALSSCMEQLDRGRPGWRAGRVGLILGTSCGGMRAAERLFARLPVGPGTQDPEAPTYFGPVAAAVRDTGLTLDPVMLVLGACASSTVALGLGCRWLARGGCDLVLAGGFDDVTVFVASGFEALRATTASPPPRPFRAGRDGMALGEGAAVFALARGGAGARAFVTGFGASTDAVHLTAPDREGRGLARAVDAALVEAGRPGIDLVSPHGTATPYSDPVEARVLSRALGDPGPVVHAFKAQIGHTLGAAGALELGACLDAMERGVLPASAGDGELDPEAPVRMLSRSAAAPVRTALKTSAAFGGLNAALVLADRAGRSRPGRLAFVSPAVSVDEERPLEELSARVSVAVDRLARADAGVRLALAAAARLEDAVGHLRGAGAVVGSALATLETNALYAERVRRLGARGASPRLFPFTSPSAVAGECAIAFGLTGPSFAVGAGLHAALEALAAAALLVEAGDADRVVVLAVDVVGPVIRALRGDLPGTGAIALQVSAGRAGACARVGAISLARGRGVDASAGAPGHAALRPLVTAPGPCVLRSGSPPDGAGRIVLEEV